MSGVNPSPSTSGESAESSATPSGETLSSWNRPLQEHSRLRAYVRMSSLMGALHELDGQTLGCWCHPKACHGDVLKRLREESTWNYRTGITRIEAMAPSIERLRQGIPSDDAEHGDRHGKNHRASPNCSRSSAPAFPVK